MPATVLVDVDVLFCQNRKNTVSFKFEEFMGRETASWLIPFAASSQVNVKIT